MSDVARFARPVNMGLLVAISISPSIQALSVLRLPPPNLEAHAPLRQLWNTLDRKYLAYSLASAKFDVVPVPSIRSPQLERLNDAFEIMRLRWVIRKAFELCHSTNDRGYLPPFALLDMVSFFPPFWDISAKSMETATSMVRAERKGQGMVVAIVVCLVLLLFFLALDLLRFVLNLHRLQMVSVIIVVVFFYAYAVQELNGYDHTGQLSEIPWTPFQKRLVEAVSNDVEEGQRRFLQQVVQPKNPHHIEYLHERRGNHSVQVLVLRSKDYRLSGQGKLWLIQHGLFDVSNSWIPLAEWLINMHHGTEVWILNTKDNANAPMVCHGRSHWTLHDLAQETRFWIERAHRSSKSKVSYLGHSQGTAQLLALLSEKPSIGDNLDQIILLGPVSFPEKGQLPMMSRLIAWLAVAVLDVVETDVVPPANTMPWSGSSMRGLGAYVHTISICLPSWIKALLNAVFKSFSNRLVDALPGLISVVRGGVAKSQLQNWLHMLLAGEFSDLHQGAYDAYDVSQIKNHIHFLYAEHDSLSNLAHFKEVPHRSLHKLPDWGHIDFLLPERQPELQEKLSSILQLQKADQ